MVTESTYTVGYAFTEGDLAALAISQGWSTAEKLAQGVARCRDLENVPGSIFALPFGQAIGRKPA